MGRRAAQVEGVYEREEGSGRWYVRYWQDGRKVRKSFGRNRAAAIAYLEKARTLKRTGEGVVPSTAKQPVLTAAEMRVAQYTVLLNDLCEGLLSRSKPIRPTIKTSTILPTVLTLSRRSSAIARRRISRPTRFTTGLAD